jgi:hypothetical protein
MAISREEFDNLKDGEDIRILSYKYGETRRIAARVIGRTKTGIKIKMLASNLTHIFTSPSDYRARGTWDANLEIATDADWQQSILNEEYKKRWIAARNGVEAFAKDFRGLSGDDVKERFSELADLIRVLPKQNFLR